MLDRRFAVAPVLVLLLACSDRKAEGEEELGASTGDSTGVSTGDAMETGEPLDCQPILQADGTASGFEQCMSSGDVFRTSAETCSNPKPPSDGNACAYGSCFSDDDCQEAPYGSCQIYGHIPPDCGCTYGCTSDAECGPGLVCMCSPVDRGTICIEADCRTDADCSAGQRCLLTPTSPNWGPSASLACAG